MKKILLATTVLVAGAGIAAADVKISGLGRFGVNYNDGVAAGKNETTVGGRLRFNIDASKETDTGVTFGGRLRLQYDIGHARRGASAVTAPGLLYVAYEGLRVEVGNVNTAIDSADLWYASEIGYDYGISGNGLADFYAYESEAFRGPSGTTIEGRDRVGIFASYSVGDFTGRVSYIQPDQFDEVLPASVDDEVSVSFDYASGPFAVSFGAYQNGAGQKDYDGYFLGASYEFSPEGSVALLYYNEDGENFNTGLKDEIQTITLTGSYSFGDTTVMGFVSSADDRGTEDVALGLGAEYDLGGATLVGAVGRDFSDDTQASFGVRFSF